MCIHSRASTRVHVQVRLRVRPAASPAAPPARGGERGLLPPLERGLLPPLERDLLVEPLSFDAEAELRQRHWLLRRRAQAEAVGRGRVGYVYVGGMCGDNYCEWREQLDACGHLEGLVQRHARTHTGGGGGSTLPVCARCGVHRSRDCPSRVGVRPGLVVDVRNNTGGNIDS